MSSQASSAGLLARCSPEEGGELLLLLTRPEDTHTSNQSVTRSSQADSVSVFSITSQLFKTPFCKSHRSL